MFLDCASIATLTALAHFKHPDVTIAGDEVIIHTLAEKDPIPIVLHHYPVCISYGIFNEGKVAISDPTYLEERVSEANMVFGINSYRELCGLHLGGITLTSSDLLLRCVNKAAKRAKLVVDLVKESIKSDQEKRDREESVGFKECLRLSQINSLAQDRLFIRLKKFKLDKNDGAGDETEEDDEEMVGIKEEDKMELEPPSETIIDLGDNSAVLMDQDEENQPKWIPEDDDVKMHQEPMGQDMKKKKKNKEKSMVKLEEDSDEEVVVLTGEQIQR